MPLGCGERTSRSRTGRIWWNGGCGRSRSSPTDALTCCAVFDAATIGIMSKSPSRPATYADLEALPENLVGELIDGELFASPRPAPIHAEATGSIYSWLREHLQTSSADRPAT